MSIWQGSIWKGSLWLGSLWKGGLWGVEGINLNLYNFYVDFKSGIVPKDLVSGQPMTTVLEAGRFNYAGTEFGENSPVIESNGDLLSNGPYSQLVPYSEDTSNWTGSGPWTRSINLGATGTYTVSTDLNGATVTITAGTATIDAGASATFGNPDQFVVSGIGTVTITTDLEDQKAQLTLSPYKLPYAINTTAGTLSVPLNYSDADEGVKAVGIEANFPQLPDALDGVADGVELFDFVTDYSYGDCTLISKNNYSIVSSDEDSGYLDPATLIVGMHYKVIYRVYDYVEGGIKIGSTAGTTRTANGTYTQRITADIGSLNLKRSANPTTLKFEIISAKQISDAKGEMTIPWTPNFDAADVSGVVHILTANDDATSFIFYNGATQEIHAFDGTNTAVVAYVPVNGTLANILLNYGDDSGLKMRLTVGTTVGAQATFAGSFPVTSDDLSIAWNEEVPQDISSIIIAKEPSW